MVLLRKQSCFFFNLLEFIFKCWARSVLTLVLVRVCASPVSHILGWSSVNAEQPITTRARLNLFDIRR